jgi:hypothetical protein
MIVSAINRPGFLPLAMAFLLLSLQRLMIPKISNIHLSPFTAPYNQIAGLTAADTAVGFTIFAFS